MQAQAGRHVYMERWKHVSCDFVRSMLCLASVTWLIKQGDLARSTGGAGACAMQAVNMIPGKCSIIVPESPSSIGSHEHGYVRQGIYVVFGLPMLTNMQLFLCLQQQIECYIFFVP